MKAHVGALTRPTGAAPLRPTLESQNRSLKRKVKRRPRRGASLPLQAHSSIRKMLAVTMFRVERVHVRADTSGGIETAVKKGGFCDRRNCLPAICARGHVRHRMARATRAVELHGCQRAKEPQAPALKKATILLTLFLTCVT